MHVTSLHCHPDVEQAIPEAWWAKCDQYRGNYSAERKQIRRQRVNEMTSKFTQTNAQLTELMFGQQASTEYRLIWSGENDGEKAWVDFRQVYRSEYVSKQCKAQCSVNCAYIILSLGL